MGLQGALTIFLLALCAPSALAQSCTGGKVYSDCGSPCSLTCDNYEERDELACAAVCEVGCFCPRDTVDNNGVCVPPEQCPAYQFECNGERCPQFHSCRTDNATGISRCSPDCQILNGGCQADQICRLMMHSRRRHGDDDDDSVSVSNEGSDSDSEGRDHDDDDHDRDDDDHDRDNDGHDSDDDDHDRDDDDHDRDDDGHDSDGHRRHHDGGDRDRDEDGHGSEEHRGSHDGEGHRRGDHDGEGHRRGDHDGEGHRRGDHDGEGHHRGDHDDFSGHYSINCVDPPYVRCGRDSFLQCDSEFLYCLQHNVSRRESCVASCLSSNGGCTDDQFCITEYDRSPSMRCLGYDDLPSDCPAGQVVNECGSHCQETCEQRVSGEQFLCLEYCGSPGCVCPQGLLLFRDRCVDPRLCYVLLEYPPAIRPLPLVGDDKYLYSLFSRTSSRADFSEEDFLEAIRELLAEEGFSSVTVTLHGIHEDGGLQIVVLLSGDDVSVDTYLQFAGILSDNGQSLPLPVHQVDLVDAGRVSSGFWTCTTIGLVSGAGGLAVLLVVLIVAVAILKRKKRRNNITGPQKLKAEVLLMDDEAPPLEEKQKLEFET